MDFPSSSLLLLLEVVRGKKSWDFEAFNACLEIIKYAYLQFEGHKTPLVGDTVSQNMTPEQMIESVLAEHEAVGAVGSILMSLALWAATKLIEKLIQH